MSKRVCLSGNEAVSIAMKQIEPDVIAAFPITPSTEVPQYYSQYVNNGEVNTEFVTVESEHSAMSACIGASAAGARVMTATSSAGLALMWETLYIASSMRLPITMALVNRTLTGPINIHNDHSDSMGARDSGWIQIYSENAQEAYDNFIQAVKIGESFNVKLPVMVCYDGFITSHAVESLNLLEDNEVKEFVGEYKPEYSLLYDKNIAMGALDTHHYYFEHKRLQVEGMINSKDVIKKVASDFDSLVGRKYGFFEEYKMDDAEVAMIIIGSSAGTSKVAVDKMRDMGVKAGVIKLRVFRPFPAEELASVLKNIKALAVMDKSENYSVCGGPLFAEVTSALYGRVEKQLVSCYIYGIGGRDYTVEQGIKVFNDLKEACNLGKINRYNYLGLRE